MEMLCNLEFSLEKSLTKNAKSLCQKRATYHRMVESMMDQFITFLWYFKQLRDNIKIGILLPDIYPETSECFSDNVKSRMDQLGWDLNIQTLSRRKPRILSGKPYIDWSEPRTFQSFDIVLIICSNTHFPIVHQIAVGQIDYDHTIFYCACSGLTRPRLENLLRTKQVLMPLIDIEPKAGDLARTDV
jgi:hypothetical protein